MIYLILISFVIKAYVLEKERIANPLGCIGGAINRCNIVERYVFYFMPFVSDLYLVLLFLERKYSSAFPDMKWKDLQPGVLW